MAMQKVVSLLLLGLGLCAAQTKFERCSFLGKDELCFETQMTDVSVHVGPDGTNDDVFLEVCSDKDKKQCCTTKALKKLLRDDWSKNDNETWDRGDFGPCKDFKFTVKSSLVVTLSKSNEDTLSVRSLTIDTKSPDKKIKETERFVCGGFELRPPLLKQTNICKTGPYHFQRIAGAEVKVGNDGTDNDVKVKVCSDSNDVCCEKKISATFSDDWKKNKLEKWGKSYFGDCAKMLFKVTNQPIISVTKNGRDDLTVSSFVMDFDVIDSPKPRKVRYTCEGFNLKGDCKNASLCRHVFNRCKISNAATNTRTTKKTTRRPASKRRPSFG